MVMPLALNGVMKMSSHEQQFAEIQSVPPSRVHREESGEIWIADDLKDHRIIRVENNFAAPLTKKYRLKDSVTEEEAAKLCTDLLKQIGVEVRQTGGCFMGMEADGAVTRL